jgi:hypothetical protein
MIFPTAYEPANPTPKRLHKILNCAHIYEGTIYIIVSIMGYLLLYQDKTDSVVLQSITTMPMLIGNNVLMQVNAWC